MIEKNKLLAGRYRLIEQIDSGGSAYIYKAFDERAKQIVAVKVLKPELTQNDEFVQRFKKEVQASLKLRHANIIRAYDAGLDDGTYYIVMDLIQGKTLKHLININGPLPIKYVISVAKKLCLALEYAHVKGFVHRDIKPHNVMIDMTGEPYIADFGIAKNLSQNTITVEDNSVMGSVHYFSPEQARGERADKRSDIYSLGILVYEMLCGRVPFDADSSVAIALKHINEPMPNVTDIMTAVPQSVNKIIQKATQKDKHFRYKSAFNMYEDLQRCLNEPEGEYIKYTENKRQQLHMEDQHAKRSKKSIKKLVATLAVSAVVIVAIILCASALIDFTVTKPMQMPNIIGLSQENAIETLKRLELIPEVNAEFSQEAPIDVVIGQEPILGMDVKKGDAVKMIISKGAGIDIMPNVTGIDIEQAKKILAESGIKIKSIIEQTDGEIPIGFVIEQQPLPNENVQDTGGVILKVKISPDVLKVKVPDVQGLSLSQGLMVLQKSGLNRYFVHEEINDAPQGTIFKQNPQKDMEQMANKPMDLWLSKVEGTAYSYNGEFSIPIEKDDTSIKIGIKDSVDNIDVYYIVYETVAQTGEQLISSDIKKEWNDTRDEITKEIIIFANGEAVQTQSVVFKKGGN
ncbi:MAG: protein kinase [Christensenellaceae bacterium]